MVFPSEDAMWPPPRNRKTARPHRNRRGSIRAGLGGGGAGLLVPRHETVLEEDIERLHPVEPPHLLAFFDRTGMILDRDLEDRIAAIQHLGGHLRTELEPDAAQVQRLDDRRAEGFVRSRLVGDLD